MLTDYETATKTKIMNDLKADLGTMSARARNRLLAYSIVIALVAVICTALGRKMTTSPPPKKKNKNKNK